MLDMNEQNISIIDELVNIVQRFNLFYEVSYGSTIFKTILKRI